MKSKLIGKDSGARKDGRQEEKRATEDEMIGRHHRLNGHESEQTLGGSDEWSKDPPSTLSRGAENVKTLSLSLYH